MINSESREMYLETILRLSENDTKPVRSVDIAEAMDFSKPSVSRAVGLLKSGGFIDIAATGEITLTEEGAYVAERIYERHRVLTAALVRLGLDAELAEESACRWEHVVSDEAFDVIKQHIGKHICCGAESREA